MPKKTLTGAKRRKPRTTRAPARKRYYTSKTKKYSIPKPFKKALYWKKKVFRKPFTKKTTPFLY